MAIYGKTLAAIAATVNTVDGWSEGLAANDSGVKFGEIPLETEAGELIGTIVFDEDGHATFEAETEYEDIFDRMNREVEMVESL